MSNGKSFNETYQDTINSIDDLISMGLYWKERCRLAEKLLDSVDNNINKRFVGYVEWEQSKKREPKVKRK